MKTIVLYRPNSEHGTQVESFIRDFRALHDDSNLEVLDTDSLDGTTIASLYDVMMFPAILALSDNGSVLKIWQGEILPLMDEVAYYTHA